MELKHISISDNEEFLRQRSLEVNFSDKSYLEDIEKLKIYCQSNGVFALATIQIGIPKRIIYLKNTTSDMEKNFDNDYNESKVLINPIITKRKGHTKFLERCASCLDYVAIIDRPYLIEVEYQDDSGVYHFEEFKGFEATVISHEYDHLNGILHIDLSEEVFELSLDETREFRKRHPYEIISETCEYESLLKDSNKKKRVSSRAIIIEDDYVYLLFRRKITEDGKIKEYYAIPGGGVDNDETIEEAVIRELKEEFSVDIKIIKYLDKRENNDSISHYFKCEIINGTPKLGGEELERMKENNYYEIRKVLLKDIYNTDVDCKDLINIDKV